MSSAADLIPVVDLHVAPITEAERTGCMAALAPILDRYAPKGARVPRPELASLSGVLLTAHAHATSPAHAARWHRLPKDEFDDTLLDHLRVLGVACRAVTAALSSGADQRTRAKLDVDLVVAATELRGRVLRYVEYQLAEEPQCAREVAGIREGSGYLDLETDLRRLAVLVGDNAALLASDRNYLHSDAAVCNQTADAIATALVSQAGSPTAWVDRLWAAIRVIYAGEVKPTAEWLYRNEPSELAAYASPYLGFGHRRSAEALSDDAASANAETIPPEPNPPSA